MKKLFTIVFISLATFALAQTNNESADKTKKYNQWSIDLGAGVTKPVRPLTTGSFTNTPALWQADLGVRYMVNDKVGFNLDLGYNSFTSDENSADFESRYLRVTLEGVLNAGHFLRIDKLHPNLGLLAHGGIGVSQLKGLEPVETGNDHMLNFQLGITPQLRLSDKIALFGDLSILGHVRQDLTFNGGDRGSLRGFDGFLVNASAGLSFYLGKSDVHADWYVVDLEGKVDDLVAQMDQLARENADDDQDGVPNYLDRDNTTESGVRVDSKGRAIDQNKNGIPDDMESALENRYATVSALNDAKAAMDGKNGTDSGLVKKLINEGYVNVYFQFNSTKPTTYSLEAINTIKTYMKDNPSATATLTGYADELGNADYNKTLSERRAKMVYDVLVASGIDASRLSYNGDGEDASVDKSSVQARQLVRRVTFKVN